MSYDIFISYSHLDNLTQQAEEENGWVDSFHLALKQYLTEFLGRESKIWRDEGKMGANYQIGPAVYQNLEKSKLLLPILSPNFLRSKWCSKELEFFCTLNNNPEDVATRIFPVVKTPIKSAPEIIRHNILKFKFFTEDKFGEGFRLLDPAFGSDFRYKFNLKISDLAHEIADYLKSIETDENDLLQDLIQPRGNLNDKNDTPDERPIIYLAEPSPDLWEQYNDIKRDLEQRECRFLPLNLTPYLPKPKQAETYKQTIRKDIENCRLAVHLIGKYQNGFPQESCQSYLQLQTDVASERDEDPNFNRLIWLPKDVEGEDEEHQKFIEQIRTSATNGVEFLQDSLEEFKTRIQEALKPKPIIEVPEGTNNSAEDNPPWIYVLSDHPDLEKVSGLEESLSKNGCAIYSTRDFWGDPKMNEIHRQYLCDCDAVLIYWHTTRIPWVKNKIHELQKIKGYGRNESFLAKGVFWDGNLVDKENCTFPSNLQMVKGYEHLSEFVSQLKSNKEALYQ